MLPTSGTAAFSSGLNTSTFMKVVQVIEYTESALAEIGQHIVTLAADEDLPAHGEAITVRAQEENA